MLHPMSAYNDTMFTCVVVELLGSLLELVLPLAWSKRGLTSADTGCSGSGLSRVWLNTACINPCLCRVENGRVVIDSDPYHTTL